MHDTQVPPRDSWAEWVLRECRDTDPERNRAYQRIWMEKVQRHFQIGAGEVLLDVGTGAGLLAFGALPVVAEKGTVIFSDISQELLDFCRGQVQELGVVDRCRFLPASADDLSALSDASVNVVTLKAVLIYVSAKERAFREFYRVLAPGGRLYVEEPINRFGEPEPEHLFWGYDISAVQDLAHKVRALYHRMQPRDNDPMFDFDERDLLRLAEAAGFARVDLELQASVSHNREWAWESLWPGMGGNPRIPGLKEAVEQTLTPDEAERFVAHLRTQVETGTTTGRTARAFLWAVK